MIFRNFLIWRNNMLRLTIEPFWKDLSFLKKTLRSLLICLLLFSVTACGPNPQDLFETAEFEMLQTNYPHAQKLYEEIIDKFPKSELAKKSRLQLIEIKARQVKLLLPNP